MMWIRCLTAVMFVASLGSPDGRAAGEDAAAEPQVAAPVPAPAEGGEALRTDSAPEVTPEISEGSGRAEVPSLDGELEKIRDPFKKPEIAPPKVAVKEEIEHHMTETFRLVGVITGPTKMKAMLVDSDGKTHFVSVGTKIGSGGGVVASISPDKIRIREKKAVVDIPLAQTPRHDTAHQETKP